MNTESNLKPQKILENHESISMETSTTLAVEKGLEQQQETTSTSTSSPSTSSSSSTTKQVIPNTTALVNIASISGGYRFYPAFLTLICFVRYVCLAMMTNSGPLLAPDTEYSCVAPASIESQTLKPSNQTWDNYLKNKCYLDLTNGSQFKCDNWQFNTSSTGITLTDSLSLVCEHDWYRSAFQSAISLGVSVAALLWGPISDEHGRLFGVKVCFVWSFLWGSISYFATSFSLYALSRAMCTIGDIGLVQSLSLVVIEIADDKLRGTVLIVVYTGWSLGVMIMPWVVGFFMDYKQVTLFTIACHLLTGPFLLIVGESVRWMLACGNFEQAKNELRRIRKLNGCLRGQEIEFERDFERLKVKYRAIANKKSLNLDEESKQSNQEGAKTATNPRTNFLGLVRTLVASFSHISEFFHSKTLAASTLAIVWIAFNGELFYMLFVMINSDIGSDLKSNYAIGFLMELVATFIGILMTTFISRRLSLITTITTISISCCFLAFAHEHEKFSVYVLNFAKIAISNLTSLVWVTSNEIFPTNLRQTGNGITGALGSLGAVLAPFVRTEFVKMIGMKFVMLILVVISGSAACVTFCLRETKDKELPDSLEEMENSSESDINGN